MKHVFIYIFILAFSLGKSYGQTLTVYPKIGVEGIPVTIDSTSIDEVIAHYGTDFRLDENPLVTHYTYKEMGLGFEFSTHDGNKIVRAITLQSPIEAALTNGIELNQSTMKDVWDLYKDEGCFNNSTEAWHSQEGVTFYIRKERNKRGYDLKERIYKIEVHNNNDLGLHSRVKFEFDDDPFDRKLDTLIGYLEEDPIDFKVLQAFLDEERIQGIARKPNTLDTRPVVERELDQGLYQQELKIGAGRQDFKLSLIKRNDSLVYLKLEETRDEYKLMIERNELSRFQDLKNLTPDFDVFVFGTSCGFTGVPPFMYSEMKKLAFKKDYGELAHWLHSINPERAVYGYIGLYFLERSGMVIQPSEAVRMEEIYDSNTKLYYCLGCLYGGGQSIGTLLSKKTLRWLYSDFKKYFILKE